MELMTLLAKTKKSVSDLSAPEFRLLSYLLARVNWSKIPYRGYLAWPATDNIIEYTGLGDSTIQNARKSLVTKGYMQYVTGHGPNSSNQYYINAQKIIDGAVASGENRPELPAAPTQIEEKGSARKQHKRNTDNLVQNKDKPPVYQKKEKPVDDNFPRWYKGVKVYSLEDMRKVDLEEPDDVPF